MAPGAARILKQLYGKPGPFTVTDSGPTLRLIWINFVHLFMVSLLPFATAWIARTRLASSPVVFYAGLFVCIDIAYNVFEHEVLARADTTQVSPPMRRMARRRSLVVLAGFMTA